MRPNSPIRRSFCSVGRIALFLALSGRQVGIRSNRSHCRQTTHINRVRQRCNTSRHGNQSRGLQVRGRNRRKIKKALHSSTRSFRHTLPTCFGSQMLFAKQTDNDNDIRNTTFLALRLSLLLSSRFRCQGVSSAKVSTHELLVASPLRGFLRNRGTARFRRCSPCQIDVETVLVLLRAWMREKSSFLLSSSDP